MKAQSRTSKWIPSIAGLMAGLFATPIFSGTANADYLWAGTQQLFGKVVSMDNNIVKFQIGCAGEPKDFRWQKGAFSVVFGEGCGEFDIPSWGEPVNCKARGRLFVAGGPRHPIHYAEQVIFANDELVLASKGNKLSIKDFRKNNFGIWMGCS